MQMKESEVLDRWTILLQKARFDNNAQKELLLFDEEVAEIISNSLHNKGIGEDVRNWNKRFLKHLMKLQEANAKIWVLEASIRKEFKTDPTAQETLSMEEIGRRALQIRDFNSLRIEAKKDIDAFFNRISDNKVDHASAVG